MRAIYTVADVADALVLMVCAWMNGFVVGRIWMWGKRDRK